MPTSPRFKRLPCLAAAALACAAAWPAHAQPQVQLPPQVQPQPQAQPAAVRGARGQAVARPPAPVSALRPCESVATDPPT
nr:hypothetical protein [Ramlibacter sp.]